MTLLSQHIVTRLGHWVGAGNGWRGSSRPGPRAGLLGSRPPGPGTSRTWAGRRAIRRRFMTSASAVKCTIQSVGIFDVLLKIS